MESLLLPYALILIGLVLMAAELFLPTAGVLLVLGIAGILAGGTMVFAYNTLVGVVTLIVLFVLVPLITPLLFRFWKRSFLGRKMILEGPEEDATVATMPVNLELEQLRGRYGKTVSALRPSGVTEFDGKRVDTLSEGDLIGPGQWVRCIDVKSGRVVVRAVDAPPDLDDFDPGDLRG